jgi:predicted nuclease with TOPRIM domain
MGLFDDILRGLPENAVLRSKVSEAKEENASLKQENAALKDDLRQAKAEIVKLKDENEALKHKPDLEETEIAILRILADDNNDHTAEGIAFQAGARRLLHHIVKWKGIHSHSECLYRRTTH